MTELTGIELKDELLERLPESVAVPTYDRATLERSIVHIGVGGFHRAHLATYIDELCRAGHTDWGIVGAGVLPGDAAMADALGAQNHFYTLISRGVDAADVRVIGSIIDYIHAYPDPEPLIAIIAVPGTQIVSLTVTEGGYPVDDVTGDYAATSPNTGDGTAFGILAAGLERRRRLGNGPVSIMSCDNVIHIGKVTRAATLGEAERLGDDDLVAWIEANVSFPNGVVDRITPATTDSDRAWLAGGGPIGLSVLSLAGWCDYLNGVDQHGREITLANDPGREPAQQLARRSRTDPAAFVGFTEVFGPVVSTSDRFRNTFVDALGRLRADGVYAAITAAIAGRLDGSG